MKRFCNDITDGILVYGDGDGFSEENLLILDFDHEHQGNFKVFYESVDNDQLDVEGNLTFKDAIAVFKTRLEQM